MRTFANRHFPLLMLWFVLVMTSSASLPAFADSSNEAAVYPDYLPDPWVCAVSGLDCSDWASSDAGRMVASQVPFGPPAPASLSASNSTDSVAADTQTESVSPPEPTVKPLMYTIQPGDTLYRIASSFGVEMEALQGANTDTDPRRLQIGEQLRIPTTADLPVGIGGQIKNVLNVTLTAYTAGYESTGKSTGDPDYGVTASGTKVEQGRTVAVDPHVIPIGSTLFIDGVGIRKAEDTGGAIRGNRIDVYMNDVHEAREFGVKPNVMVYVLKSGGSV